MEICFYILMFVIGSCFGSFLCCQARRLHLKDTKKPKSKKNSKHHKKNKSKDLGNRSICLHCKKQLKWYDNIPVLSWLILKGKCRYCHKKIGFAEILSEIGMGLAFLLISRTFNISLASPIEWVILIAMLLLVSVLGFLAIYDGLYGELPSLCLVVSIAIATIILALKVWNHLRILPFSSVLIIDPLLAVVILGGLYLVLYLISSGKWVGDGDWMLGTAISIALGTPWLALVTLFIANFTACLTMYPLIKKRKNHKIHFGPFLVIAFVIVYSFAIPLSNLIGS